MGLSHPLGLGLKFSLFNGQCTYFITQIKNVQKKPKPKTAKEVIYPEGKYFELRPLYLYIV